MARLWSSGFELNSTTAGMEFDTKVDASSKLSISTTTVRSGTYALQANTNAASQLAYLGESFGDTNGISYYRVYINISSCTISGNGGVIFNILDSSENSYCYWVVNDNSIGFFSNLGSSNFRAWTADRWYKLEMKIDNTTLSSTKLQAYIDGVLLSNFASENFTGWTDPNKIFVGIDGTTNNINIFFDDIGINSSSGSFQNSYPGDGKIIHLQPNQQGGTNQWLKSGGGAGDSNNYQDVDEVSPDDATSYLKSKTLNHKDFYYFPTPPVRGTDKVKLISTGVRFSGAAASANSSLVVTAAMEGNTDSAAITPTSTTWLTNAVSTPRNYPVTVYTWDGASLPFSVANHLFAANFGYQINLSTTNTNEAQVSTVWLLLEYQEDRVAGGYSMPSVNKSSKTEMVGY